MEDFNDLDDNRDMSCDGCDGEGCDECAGTGLQPEPAEPRGGRLPSYERNAHVSVGGEEQ